MLRYDPLALSPLSPGKGHRSRGSAPDRVCPGGPYRLKQPASGDVAAEIGAYLEGLMIS